MSLPEKSLEEDSEELTEIRAMLLVEFREGNRYGFVVRDEGSTIDMLMKVLKRFILYVPGKDETR